MSAVPMIAILAASALGADERVLPDAEARLARAVAAVQAGRLAEAQGMLAPLVDRTPGTVSRPVPGDVYVPALQTLAVIQQVLGDSDRAEALLRRALAATPPDSVRHAECLNGLAGIHLKRGELGPAERLASRAVRTWERLLGGDSVAIVAGLNTLAESRMTRGDLVEAERLLRRADRLAAMAKAAPMIRAGVGLRRGLLWLRMGRYGDAEPVLERSLELAEEDLGPAHPALVHIVQALSQCYRLRNRPLDAQHLDRRWSTLARPSHP